MPEPLIDSSRLVPEGLLRGLYRPFQPLLEGLLGLRAVNRLYARNSDPSLDPGAFCAAILADLGVAWRPDEAALRAWRQVQGPAVLLANHPLGGRDAIALLALLSLVRPDYKLLANYILRPISEVQPGLILVDPFGGGQAARTNLAPLRQASAWLKQGGLLGIFPAGEVSAWRADEQRIADIDWAPQAARLIQSSGATVLPLRFHGVNRRRFYAAGRIHPLLRTVQIPAELVAGPTRNLRPVLGAPIAHDKLPGLDAEGLSRWLRGHVYDLSPKESA